MVYVTNFRLAAQNPRHAAAQAQNSPQKYLPGEEVQFRLTLQQSIHLPKKILSAQGFCERSIQAKATSSLQTTYELLLKKPSTPSQIYSIILILER